MFGRAKKAIAPPPDESTEEDDSGSATFHVFVGQWQRPTDAMNFFHMLFALHQQLAETKTREAELSAQLKRLLRMTSIARGMMIVLIIVMCFVSYLLWFGKPH